MSTEIQPETVRDYGGGTQRLYRFENGYGASVIQNEYSYGRDQGLWELGVCEWDGKDFHLTYDTPITDDVIGHLTETEVAALLEQIKAFPARRTAKQTGDNS